MFHFQSLPDYYPKMTTSKIFRYLICCMLLSSFAFAAGCSSNENRVVEPTSKEKRDAEEAKGTLDAAKV
ncbi:hypothetical protein RBSH_02146 [Rhodopirellula baltica SH28]|uniref:Secreted protein n=1 Tax=Rhodopirellula baltica SH28 TaxID=993517 RepID=K5D6Z2_RHOBT|nr:hypothetical protein RBSH_02146 [Rhodopirellula baltica SH28]